MKKLLLLGTAALVMSATTAFAYTNEYAGYTINNKTPECVLEGSKTYGYMNLADKSIHTVSFFDEAEMETVMEGKFTTAVFEENYAKLAVLEKNKLDKSILKLPLLDFARYTKLKDNGGTNVMNNSINKLQENIKPEIRLDKIGGKKVITVSMLYKQNGELFNTDVSFVSANNKLYMLASGSTQELAVQEKAAAGKENLANKLEPVARDSVDALVLAKLWKSHTNYVKSFKVIPPVKSAQPSVAYTDVVLGKKVTLPKDWGYMQYNHNDKKNPGSLCFALPINTVYALGEKFAAKPVVELPEKEVTAQQLGMETLDCVEQVFVSGSVKVGKDKDLAELLANPLTAKLQADLFFKEGLKHLKNFGNAYLNVNDYKYASNFATNKASVDVFLDVTAWQKYDFLNNIKLTATPEKTSGLIFLTKKGLVPNAKMQAVYDNWSF